MAILAAKLWFRHGQCNIHVVRFSKFLTSLVKRTRTEIAMYSVQLNHVNRICAPRAFSHSIISKTKPRMKKSDSTFSTHFRTRNHLHFGCTMIIGTYCVVSIDDAILIGLLKSPRDARLLKGIWHMRVERGDARGARRNTNRTGDSTGGGALRISRSPLLLRTTRRRRGGGGRRAIAWNYGQCVGERARGEDMPDEPDTQMASHWWYIQRGVSVAGEGLHQATGWERKRVKPGI